MTLREQIEAQNLAWQRFHEWESTEAPPSLDAAHVIADLGAILSWISPEERMLDPDPEKHGVRKMFEVLRLIRYPQ